MLLITDVTRLQPFTAGGDSFRENIETLVSYNIRTDGLQQDCLYIEQGHLMTPTTFMTYSMAIDPCKTVIVTWTPIRMYSMQQGSQPSSLPGSPLYTSSERPAVSCFMPYPTKPKGGWQQPHQVVVNKSTAQLREKKATRKFMNKYQEIIQNSMAQGPNDPQGPFLYQENGKTYASLPVGMLQNIQKSPLFDKMKKRLPGGRSRNTTNYYGEGPGGTYANSTGVFTESGGWTNAADGQPSDDERTGGKERPDEDLNDGVQGHRASKTQVSHVALQTDTCDTLYVTKNTLTTYTIAIVQNSQVLQYDQMHTALQTVRNQASLETPLRAEELLTAHSNLAVLEDQKDINISPDAQKSTDTTQDAEPSASAPDDQMYIKIPSRYTENSATRRPHPTGAIAPTCRCEYGLVNTIPAGYESDDSWDNLSHTHEHTHTHNIVPLLTLRPWRNSPRRGCEQQQPRQNNNTNV